MTFAGPLSRWANTREGTTEIRPGSHFHTTFHTAGFLNEIAYHFVVELGPPVDVYIVTEAGYLAYMAREPLPANQGVVEENVTEASGSPYPDEGLWHVIIDNSDYGGAKPNGAPATVLYRVVGGGIPFVLSGAMCMTAGLFILMGLVLIVVYHNDTAFSPAPRVRARRVRKSLGPPPSSPPGVP